MSFSVNNNLSCTCGHQHKITKGAIYDKKAKNQAWKGLHKISDKMAASYGITLSKNLNEFRKKINISNLIDIIQRNKSDIILSIIEWQNLTKQFDLIKKLVKRGIIDAGKYSIDYMPEVLKPEIIFDAKNPRIQKYIDKKVGERIQGITDQSKIAIQTVISQGMNKGSPIRTIAENIPRSIGLNDRQAMAVVNYQAGLLDKGIGGKKLENMTDSYYEKMLDYRTTTIARTESMDAVNQGQLEVWDQAAEQGLYDPSKAVKRWIVTPDDRLCEACQDMDQQEVGMDESFDSPEFGEIDAPPLHPSCRCIVELDITV
jgi:hypothetical protein